MTILTTIVGDILTASNTATVTNKTISRADNTLTVRMANDVSGTLPVTNGGTGQTSCFGEGEILIGNTTGNTLTKTTLTAGCNISVTNGNGSITIDYCVPIVYSNTIWGWGRNVCGQLGDNTTTGKSSPISVIGGFTDWCQVSAGVTSVAAVRSNGTAWAWGYNCVGGLGDNTTVNKSSPVSVVGGFTDWCQISMGCLHTFAVRSNGTAWAWGDGGQGRLGDNTSANKSSPVSVVGGFTDWSKVAASFAGGAGLRQNGTIWSWGQNTYGQLGDNTTVSKSSPVSVVGGFTDWCQVSASGKGNSDQHRSVAIRSNGTAWAWGNNRSGQLGDGTTTNRSSPVSVVGGFTDWCQIEAGPNQVVAVRTTGTAWAWGYNVFGQLGDNTTSNKNSPVQVVGGFTNWCQLSGGRYNSTGVRQNGTAWTWGNNNAGQLGTNNTTATSSPVSVVGGFTNWCHVSAGSYFQVGIISTVV